VQTRWSSFGRSSPWALVALAASLALSGCRSAAAPAAPLSSGPSHGTLNAPLYGRGDPALAEAVRAGAVQLDPATGRVVAALARSWSHDRAATQFTFRVRPGAAAQLAARWTAVRQADPTALPGLVSAAAVGPRVVSVRLEAPDRGWVAYLAQPVTWLPFGGPYKIASRGPASIDLVRNPGFAGPPAAIGQIHLHVYAADDLNGAFADYRAGRLDFARVPPGQISLVKSDPKLAGGLISQPRLELVAVGIGALAPGMRRAIALATPADASAADVAPGSSIAADGLIPQGVADYLPGASPYRFDPAAARAAAGSPLPKLRLAYPDDAFHRRIAGVVLGGFAAAGLRVLPQPIAPARYSPRAAHRTPLWLIDATAAAPSAEGMLGALAVVAPAAGIDRVGDPDVIQRRVLAAARVAPLRYELSSLVVARRVRVASVDVMGVVRLDRFSLTG
jgi:ABC-type transport system substrate-binding protein